VGARQPGRIGSELENGAWVVVAVVPALVGTVMGAAVVLRCIQASSAVHVRKRP
jgi:hypothetical protein